MHKGKPAPIKGQKIGIVIGHRQAGNGGLSMGGATGVWLGTHAPDRFFRLAICGALPWLGPPQPMNARIEAVLALHEEGGFEGQVALDQ